MSVRLPESLRVLLTRKMLICVFTGFSSGLPLYLLLNLLPAWMRSEGVDLKTIGFFALIQFPYTWKFLWSPFLDRYAVPLLGRRRGWTFLMQIGLLLTIGSLGGLSPTANITPVLWLAALLALFSATQDIALDAYRRELLADVELGLGNAVHVNAYRVAGLVPGSLSLILADLLPWSQVFWITAAFMIPGMVMILLVSEPAATGASPRTLREAVVEPFHEFMTRSGARGALLILAFIFLYKLGDSLCTALATPFYLDMGFTKTDIGLIAKHAGLWPAVIGALLGGLLGAASFALLQAGSRLLDWRRFFAISETLLLLLGGAMLMNALDRASGQLMGMDLPEQLYAWLGDPLWDSSAWLDDGSRLGGLIAGLTGYRAMPSAVAALLLAGFWLLAWFWRRAPRQCVA